MFPGGCCKNRKRTSCQSPGEKEKGLFSRGFAGFSWGLGGRNALRSVKPWKHSLRLRRSDWQQNLGLSQVTPGSIFRSARCSVFVVILPTNACPPNFFMSNPLHEETPSSTSLSLLQRKASVPLIRAT
jgi:hypothetical protein